MLSFVVPAHDEEALLPATLASIAAAMRGADDSHEVIVVDDASTDRTAQVAAAAGARVVSIQARQISAARNAGARAAQGELLVFIDADTTITVELMAAVTRAVRDGAVAGGCGVHFEGPLPRWARLLEPVARRFSRLIGMAAGCFLFCTRAAFTQAGGFDEGVFAGEEALISMRLKRAGRFVVLRELATTSGRKLRTHSGLELGRALARLALRGRSGVTQRAGLDLWYGPRRPDPAAAPEPTGTRQ